MHNAYPEIHGEDGKVFNFLAAILNALSQHSILTDEVKSSLVTPAFKKGDGCDQPDIDQLHWVSRSADYMLPSSIAASSARLKVPCQAGLHPCMSTEHQLFALRHLIDRSRFQKLPLFAAFVDLRKTYGSVQQVSYGHPYGAREFRSTRLQSLSGGGAMSMKQSAAKQVPLAWPTFG